MDVTSPGVQITPLAEPSKPAPQCRMCGMIRLDATMWLRTERPIGSIRIVPVIEQLGVCFVKHR